MAFVGLIPARGGSQRIPRKNLAPCAGKPLIAYTVEAAKGSRILDHTLVSTDDTEIAEAGRHHGAEVPFIRPAGLAGSATPMIAVMQHALNWLRQNGRRVEAIVLLQPTSPLRTAQHIDEAISVFQQHPDATSVCSVVRPPHIFHPLKVLKPGVEGLMPYIDGSVVVPGQLDLPPAFARNGPAILVTRSTAIDAGELYGSPCVPYEMPAEASVDVDTPLDLQIAEAIMTYGETRAC